MKLCTCEAAVALIKFIEKVGKKSFCGGGHHFREKKSPRGKQPCILHSTGALLSTVRTVCFRWGFKFVGRASPFSSFFLFSLLLPGGLKSSVAHIGSAFSVRRVLDLYLVKEMGCI